MGLPVTLWCSDDELHYEQGIHYLFVLCITDWTGDIGQQAAAALFPIFIVAQCLLFHSVFMSLQLWYLLNGFLPLPFVCSLQF